MNNSRFENCDQSIGSNKAVIIGKDRLRSASDAGERDVEREKATSAFHINHSSFISLVCTRRYELTCLSSGTRVSTEARLRHRVAKKSEARVVIFVAQLKCEVLI